MRRLGEDAVAIGRLEFLKADSASTFQERGPTSSIIQHGCVGDRDTASVCVKVLEADWEMWANVPERTWHSRSALHVRVLLPVNRVTVLSVARRRPAAPTAHQEQWAQQEGFGYPAAAQLCSNSTPQTRICSLDGCHGQVCWQAPLVRANPPKSDQQTRFQPPAAEHLATTCRSSLLWCKMTLTILFSCPDQTNVLFEGNRLRQRWEAAVICQ